MSLISKGIYHITVLGIGLFLSVSFSAAQPLQENIRLNQIGFYPKAPKTAVIIGAEKGIFYLVNEKGEKVFTGKMGEPVQSEFSDKKARKADFSTFSKPGVYRLAVPGAGSSPTFEIAEDVHQNLADASLKAFYFQRASTALPKKYVGKWARPAGHPDDQVKIHAAAATSQRPEGSIFNSSKGWYDAGDYGKYIVNSGITMGTLLSLYEDFPEYFKSHKDINIPESGDGVPDLLDEVAWNLRWMLTMQDPADGGVYHKMTTADFEGMIMPHEAKSQRFFIKKSTTAALDFAAVLAQASRIYQAYEGEFPGLADSCLQMAEKAWNWAEKNPDELYNQRAMNEKYDPDINTGAYGDRDAADEFVWAAAELLITTGDKKYADAVTMAQPADMEVPNWGNVQLIGYYSLFRHQKTLPAFVQDKIKVLQKNFMEFAAGLTEGVDENIYYTVMGQSAEDFVWGSNAVAANQAVALIQAFNISKDKKYLGYALTNLDYVLGRNGTGYSFVTGFGDKTPMFPHHRPSEADDVAAPIPGLLAGGPNPGQQDRCNYASDAADESYVDHVCSYASNEIAINWNAPLVYLAYALENLQDEF